MTKFDPAVFDVSRWRPITYQAYAEALGSAFLTITEPTQLPSMCELTPDGRCRIVTLAHVITKHATDSTPPEADDEPYLMMLFDQELWHNGKDRSAHCFVRTDVDLAMG